MGAYYSSKCIDSIYIVTNALINVGVTHSPLIYRLQLYYPLSMDIKSKIGNKIRKLRHQRDLSQEQFANVCGLDRTYIAGIEQGKRNVSIVNLEKIAKAFEISLSELFKDL